MPRSSASPVLVGLPYSPWSEKARWALELRGIAYTQRRYQPILGEMGLRRMTGRWRGNVTVPVLIDGTDVLSDSYEIARWADQHGDGPQLFPADREAEVARWNELGENGLAAGRALALVRILDDREALLEMVPKAIRNLPGGLAVRIARWGVARTLRKYAETQSDDPRQTLTRVLDALRHALAAHTSDEPKTLLGTFSYADVTAAQVLAFVEPPKSGLRIATASRRGFSDPELAGLYGDLLHWRDALYSRWRSRAA